jgi:hypothetical protein
MLKLLSKLVSWAIVLGVAGMVAAQPCPPGTIGVYFDTAGNSQFIQPVQHQNLFLYIILFAEAPVGGAAWRLELTSPQYSDSLVGPVGPDCQPPICEYQDPPFWYVGFISEGSVVLGDPFGGIRQGFTQCQLGFNGTPILLGTLILNPWADILGQIEVDVNILPEEYEGLVYALCSAQICDSVTPMPGHIGATVIQNKPQSWGSVKALYR